MAERDRRGSSKDRRVVTVLFADISGFTSLSERLDPEVMTEFLRDCIGNLIDEIAARDGWVEKQIGDAILAVFGAPVAHEDDPVRAVDAALGMRERMRSMGTRFASQVGTAPALHVGVNTGLVVTTEALGGDRRDAEGPIVIGDTVNVGARLQQAADPDQILVGATTFEATRSTFDYRRVGPLSVKGKRTPLAAFECLGARTASAPETGSIFVGRDRELALLASCLGADDDGTGQIVVVTGDVGIGKSRLVREAKARATDRDRPWLEGRALAYGETLSYWPFVEAIRGWVGPRRDEGPHDVWSDLEESLRGLFGPSGRDWLSPLAAFLGLNGPDGRSPSPNESPVAGSTGGQIFRACRRLFDRIATERGLVIVLEDLHWADQSSMRLLEHLLPLTETTPVVFVLTWRNTGNEPTSRLHEHLANRFAGRCTRIELGPLSEAAAGELVDQAIRPVEPERRTQRGLILQRARGNPFFLNEMGRVLLDTDAQADAPIPHSLRGVIASRVDHLPPGPMETLRVAAVVGHDFTPRMLREVAQVEVSGSLNDLVARGLIERHGMDPEADHTFVHPLVHVVVYESVLLAHRRELHRRVARSLELRDGGLAGQRFALLAYHYSRAEDWERAKRYLVLAGDEAAHIAADAESLHHYAEAMIAHDRASGDPWEPIERAQLERKIGEALFRRGSHAEGLAYLHRALEHLGTPFPHRVRSAIVREVVRRAPRRLLPRARPRDGGRVAVERERLLIYERAAWIDYFLDPERFVLDNVMLLNSSELLRERESIVNACAALAIVLDLAGMDRLARRYLARAHELARQIDSAPTDGAASLSEGVLSYNHGRWRSATEWFERSAAAYRSAGDLRGWGTATSVTPWLLGYQGRLHESLERSRELARVADEAGDAQLRAWGLMGIGKSLRALGDLDEAADPLADALHSFRSIPDPLSVSDATIELGLLESRRGDIDRALATLQRAIQLAVDGGFKGFITTQGYAGLASALLAIAERAEGGDRETALAEARGSIRKAIKIGKVVAPGTEAAYRARGTLAWLRRHPKAAMRWWQRSLDLSQAFGSELERGLTEFEIGKRLRDRARLASAEEIFTRLGAKLDLEDTRTALSTIAAGGEAAQRAGR